MTKNEGYQACIIFAARLIWTGVLATVAWAVFKLADAPQSWWLLYFSILLILAMVTAISYEWRSARRG